ncbi:Hint domain-containing protein [Cobetia marina]
MAVINVNLLNALGNNSQTIDSSDSAGDAENDVNLNVLGSYELIVDGINANINSIAGAGVLATKSFTAINGANVDIDQGLLSLDVGSTVEYNVGDSSSINLDASSVGVAGGGLLSTNNVNYTGSESGNFTFTTSSGLEAANTTTFNVSGMGDGDTFNVVDDTGWTLADGENSYSNGALNITTTSGLSTVNANVEMTEAEANAYIADPSSLNSDEGFTFVCFAEGTMITTSEGEVAVEDLSIGDMIVTAEGNTVAVKWVGRQTVRPAKAQDKFQAIRFQENAIAPGLPNQDLTVTASHGMIIDGLVINAGALVNGSTINTVEASELPKEVTYYHIETENHEVILANGAAAETYIDYVDRKAFENYDEYLSLYGMDTTITEMKRPRISARRLLPLAIRERFGIQEPQLATQAA